MELKDDVEVKKEMVFRYTQNQQMWNYIADNPGITKEETIERFSFTEEELQDLKPWKCFACGYTRKMYAQVATSKCAYCPLDTSSIVKDYPEVAHLNLILKPGCLMGLYQLWGTATDTCRVIEYDLSDVYNTEAIVALRVLMNQFDLRVSMKDNLKKLCEKYARAIANLKPRDGVKYI